jgi:hypothetical protein
VENAAKIWLTTFDVAYNYGYNARELNHIVRPAKENQSQLLEAWHEYFGQ